MVTLTTSQTARHSQGAHLVLSGFDGAAAGAGERAVAKNLAQYLRLVPHHPPRLWCHVTGARQTQRESAT